jgi:hypothetical protein
MATVKPAKGLIMVKKYAAGGAMGGLDNISEAANQLSDSLDQISSGLYGNEPTSTSAFDLSGSSGSSFAPPGNSTPVRSLQNLGLKKGGKVVKKASGGMTASSRGDGIAQRGKTRGKMC